MHLKQYVQLKNTLENFYFMITLQCELIIFLRSLEILRNILAFLRNANLHALFLSNLLKSRQDINKRRSVKPFYQKMPLFGLKKKTSIKLKCKEVCFFFVVVQPHTSMPVLQKCTSRLGKKTIKSQRLLSRKRLLVELVAMCSEVNQGKFRDWVV